MPFRTELKRPDLKGQFPCSVCGKVFCHSSSLSRHRMQAHFKSYICTQCRPNCEIASSETLRTHMARFHQISRMFMCKCCNWAFPDKTSLHIHIQSMEKSHGTDPGDVVVLARSSVEGGPIDPSLLMGDEFDDSSQEGNRRTSSSPASSLSCRDVDDGSYIPTLVNSSSTFGAPSNSNATERRNASIFPPNHSDSRQLGLLRKMNDHSPASINGGLEDPKNTSSTLTPAQNQWLLNWLANNPHQLASLENSQASIASAPQHPIFGAMNAQANLFGGGLKPEGGNVFAAALAALQMLGCGNSTPNFLNDSKLPLPPPPQKKRAKLRTGVLSATRKANMKAAKTPDLSVKISAAESKRARDNDSGPSSSSKCSPQSDHQHGKKQLSSLIDNLLLARSEAEGTPMVDLQNAGSSLTNDAGGRKNKRKARTPQQLTPQPSSREAGDDALEKKETVGRDGNSGGADEAQSPEQPSPAVSNHSQTSGSSANAEGVGVSSPNKCLNCDYCQIMKNKLEESERNRKKLEGKVAEMTSKLFPTVEFTANAEGGEEQETNT